MIEEKSDNLETAEPEVSENTPEVSEVESAPESETKDVIDPDKPVSSSIEAHKVLDAQKEKNQAQVKDKKNFDNTGDMVPRKQYLEIQKLANKHDRELSELRKFQQAYQQKEKQQEEQKQQQEFQKLVQQNPTEAYRQLARKEAAQQMAPMQQALADVQATSLNNQIQSILGEKYSEYSPLMADVIDEFQEIDRVNSTNPDPSKMTRYAEEIASQPKVLIELTEKKISELNKTKAISISDQRKANNLRIASGVAKKSNVKSETPQDFSKLSLSEMTQEMKRMGILNKN